MKRFFMVLICITVCLLCSCSAIVATPVQTPASSAEQKLTGHKITADIPLYSSDDTYSLLICTLPAATVVCVLDNRGGFARVEASGGLRGYIEAAAISEDSMKFAGSAKSSGQCTVICREYLPVYAKAGAQDAFWTLHAGETVTVHEHEGSYAKISSEKGDISGYVNASFLSAGEVKQSKHEKYTATCDEYLNLRKLPDRTSEVLCTVPAGAQVELICFYGAFAQVKHENKTGYVVAAFLTKAMPELSVVCPKESYSYSDMCADIDELKATFKGRVTSESIGKSVLKREIPVLIIGKKTAKNHFLIVAGTHGREHMTSLLVMAQADALLSMPLPEDVCYHIIPMLNPDGIAISQGESVSEKLLEIYRADKAKGYTAEGKSDYFKHWKANANGIDLNRNFETDFGIGKLRKAPSQTLYPGKSSVNQPESSALKKYTEKQSYRAVISYHASGSCIYWQHVSAAKTNNLSNELALCVQSVTRYPLRSGTVTEGGSYKDWVIAALNTPSLTVEIGSRICPLPIDEFCTVWERNKGVLPALAAF